MESGKTQLMQNGIITRIGETIQVTSTFRKREFEIETTGNYPQTLKFEAVQDRCEKLDNLSTGSNVDVYFNLKGQKSEYNGKQRYFMSLEAWKVWEHRGV